SRSAANQRRPRGRSVASVRHAAGFRVACGSDAARDRVRQSGLAFAAADQPSRRRRAGRHGGHQPPAARAATLRRVWFLYQKCPPVEFEFDPHKSVTNQEKHDINFPEARRLWQDTMRVEVPARTVDEPRWLVIGRIDGKHWSAVVTYREQRTRIISVRRSRDEEVSSYGSYSGGWACL